MTEMIKWPDLYDLLPEKECDSFALDKFEGCNSFRCYIPPGRYVRLVRKINGKRLTSVIMSNTPMEQRTCVSVAYLKTFIEHMPDGSIWRRGDCLVCTKCFKQFTVDDSFDVRIS